MIDKNSDRSVYLQIADRIKEKIERGELTEGAPIDSENKLAENYQVSRLTARRATDHLVNLGLVQRIRGKGTFVLKKEKLSFTPQKLHGFTEEMMDLQMKPSNIVAEFRIMEVPKEIEEKLKISPGEMVYYVKRIRCVEDLPLILEESYLPMDLLPELNVSVLKGSKYDYVEKFTGKKITESLQEFTACLAGEVESSYLKVDKGSPLLVITNQSFLEDGRVFEYSTALYRKSKHKVIQKAVRG